MYLSVQLAKQVSTCSDTPQKCLYQLPKILLQLWRDLKYLLYCTGCVPAHTHTHTHVLYTHTLRKRNKEALFISFCLLFGPPPASSCSLQNIIDKTILASHWSVPCHWQLVSPPCRSLHVDRSAMRARASESGVETGRAGEGKKGDRGEDRVRQGGEE